MLSWPYHIPGLCMPPASHGARMPPLCANNSFPYMICKERSLTKLRKDPGSSTEKKGGAAQHSRAPDTEPIQRAMGPQGTRQQAGGPPWLPWWRVYGHISALPCQVRAAGYVQWDRGGEGSGGQGLLPNTGQLLAGRDLEACRATLGSDRGVALCRGIAGAAHGGRARACRHAGARGRDRLQQRGFAMTKQVSGTGFQAA